MALWTSDLINVVTYDDAIKYSILRDDTIKMKKICYPLLNWDNSDGTDIDRNTLEKRMKFFELVRMQEAPSTLSPFWIEIIQNDDYTMYQLGCMDRNYIYDRIQNIYLYFVLIMMSVIKLDKYLSNPNLFTFFNLKRFFLIKSCLMREYMEDINRYHSSMSSMVRSMISVELMINENTVIRDVDFLIESYRIQVRSFPF